MPIDESHLAEAALKVFAGRELECEYNGRPLDPVTGDCGDDSHTHCPFCGATGGVECGHVLANWDSEQGYDGPPLPVPPPGAENLGGLTDDQKKAVLKEFFPLCAVYEEYLSGESYPPNSFYYRLKENWLYSELAPWVRRQLPDIWVASWGPNGPGGADGEVWYSAQPDQSREQMRALAQRVAQAFAALRPAPGSN